MLECREFSRFPMCPSLSEYRIAAYHVFYLQVWILKVRPAWTPNGADTLQKVTFFGTSYSAGFRWFSIDSIALKSMLELCFDSFKTDIDRDHRAGRWEGGGPGTRRTKSRPDQSKSNKNQDQGTENSRFF